EAGDGTVVDNFAFGGAPTAVNDLVDGDFVDVPSDKAIHEGRGVPGGDAGLEEGGDIDEGGGVTDGGGLVVWKSFIDANGVVTGPFAVVQALAKGESAFVKRRTDRQANLRKSPAIIGKRAWRRKARPTGCLSLDRLHFARHPESPNFLDLL